jgi:DNA polymerase III epsilon subunit-like protein
VKEDNLLIPCGFFKVDQGDHIPLNNVLGNKRKIVLEQEKKGSQQNPIQDNHQYDDALDEQFALDEQLILVDLEKTSGRKDAGICSIALYNVHSKEWLNYPLVNPKEIPTVLIPKGHSGDGWYEYSTELHKITPELVKNAREQKDVLKNVLNWMTGNGKFKNVHLIAHNISCEYHTLSHWFTTYALPWQVDLNIRWIESRDFLGGVDPITKKWNLGYLYEKATGLQPNIEHQADADVKMMLDIAKALGKTPYDWSIYSKNDANAKYLGGETTTLNLVELSQLMRSTLP